MPEEALRSLFPERFARAMRFRQRSDRLRCLGAGYLLHQVLGIPEAVLCTNAYGKPYVPDRPGDFSLSHGGDLIVLAVADRAVGVDVEPLGRRHGDIAKRVFKPEEIEWMNAGDDPDRRFFELWTLKEAVMKAEGKGLSLSPETFSVLPALSNAPIRSEGGEQMPVDGSKLIYVEGSANFYEGATTEQDGHIISYVGGKQ